MPKQWVWMARGFIGVVAFFNLQAAAQFLASPGRFAAGFELTGAAGDAMIRGMGLLFLMWNIPYLVALLDPLKHHVSLVEAVIMQFIGVTGESAMLILFTGEHPALQQTVMRFIYFDGAGFLAMLAALIIILAVRKRLASHSSD